MKILNHHNREESHYQDLPCIKNRPAILEKLLSESLIVIIQKMFYQKGTTP